MREIPRRLYLSIWIVMAILVGAMVALHLPVFLFVMPAMVAIQLVTMGLMGKVG